MMQPVTAIRFIPDTNVLVAIAQAPHVNHEAARSELEARLDDGEVMILAAHCLAETYAVLTGFPLPRRLSPVLAWAAIDKFVGSGEVVALSAESYLAVLENSQQLRVVGGRVHDAVIAATARSAGVDVLLTFNLRHFADAVGFEVIAPSVR